MTADEALPDFRDPHFLTDHIRRIMEFYDPAAIDRQQGGFFQGFDDAGRVADPATRHLVGTTRFIVNYARAGRRLGRPDYCAAAGHGLRFLEEAHRDPAHGGWFWLLDGRMPLDTAKHAYGHAFVLLAYAAAAEAGVPGARDGLAAAWDVLERRFWSPADRLYADEISADWRIVSPYRGQNANMHMTEAMLAAYEATGEGRYLDRAELLAGRICLDLAAAAGGLVWEHYRADWSVDWDYNRDDPKNLFRPYGFLAGHLTEWTKLLLGLERHRPLPWLLPRARAFYQAALSGAADLAHGGLHYSFAADGTLLDPDNYHWVHAETIAAAAALALRTGETRFWQDYDRLWAYAWRHFVDRAQGGWYRILEPDGRRQAGLKSPPGEPDYHPLGACEEVLRWLAGAGRGKPAGAGRPPASTAAERSG